VTAEVVRRPDEFTRTTENARFGAASAAF